MNDITAPMQHKGQTVKAPYYLAECLNCGELMPSSKLVVSRNYPDGDADCYCPHCNADDCDIADLGKEAVAVWNFQQTRIDALVEALEAKQPHHNGMMQLSNELVMAKQRIAELEARTEQQPVAIVDVQSGRQDGNKFALTFTLAGQALPDDVYHLYTAPPAPAPVTVKLPKAISVLHRMDFNDAHRSIYAYPAAELNAALTAAGIQVIEGEGQ